MAVSGEMRATPTAPDHGDTLTVEYVVTGNDPIPPSTAGITGGIVVDGVPMDLSASVIKPGTPAATVTYRTPVCEGLTFTVVPGTPSVFTAVVPQPMPVVPITGAVVLGEGTLSALRIDTATTVELPDPEPPAQEPPGPPG